MKYRSKKFLIRCGIGVGVLVLLAGLVAGFQMIQPQGTAMFAESGNQQGHDQMNMDMGDHQSMSGTMTHDPSSSSDGHPHEGTSGNHDMPNMQMPSDGSTHDAEGGHGGSHESTDTSPNINVRSLVVGGFVISNGAVLAIAGFLKRLRPQRKHPIVHNKQNQNNPGKGMV
jgi:hypothetical protein